MQIVIPMSGFGERFRRAGYNVPKPLIKVDDKTIIEHVIALFPGETEVIFVCNQNHLEEPAFRMREILTAACPTGRIVGIEPHKLGPVFAVQQAADHLDRNRPVVVSYCDFSQYWDWLAFKKFVVETGCDGSIPSYRGFHPHSLGSTLYAYLKLDASEEWLVDIQEKRPWTSTPMNEFASSGVYYFRSARLMLDYFDRCVAENLNVNGEFYLSMVYRPMARDGLRINAYPIEYFMQWGTPEDLKEYQGWDRLFRKYVNGRPPRNNGQVEGSLVIPMAGSGSRFAREGYTTPKPLIEVGEETMIERAIGDMPRASRLIVVTRADLPGTDDAAAALERRFGEIHMVTLKTVSAGQAISCLEGLGALSDDERRQPLTIGACDNGVVFDADRLRDLDAADCLVWGYRGHAASMRHPRSYSWIDADERGRVRRVGIKEPIGDLETTPIVIGAFSFKTTDLFKEAVDAMVARDLRVNNEFYADTAPNILIERGFDVRLFEVEHYVSFGTPDELRTYQYWEQCFSRWKLHPLGGGHA